MLNFKHVYDEDTGEEDLKRSYNRAVRNVRILVEIEYWKWSKAVEYVSEKMRLTPIEHDRLFNEAGDKYGI